MSAHDFVTAPWQQAAPAERRIALVEHASTSRGGETDATYSRLRSFQTVGVAGLLALCLVGVTRSPYVRVPFAVAACVALLAGEFFTRKAGCRNPVARRGCRWLVALVLLLTLAGLAFAPIPDSRPSFFVVLAASVLAAAMYAIAADG
jgi:uncharacterized membrane protein YoaK (UPF0700 family)